MWVRSWGVALPGPLTWGFCQECNQGSSMGCSHLRIQLEGSTSSFPHRLLASLQSSLHWLETSASCQHNSWFPFERRIRGHEWEVQRAPKRGHYLNPTLKSDFSFIFPTSYSLKMSLKVQCVHQGRGWQGYRYQETGIWGGGSCYKLPTTRSL